jgi:WD40 repeat protein
MLAAVLADGTVSVYQWQPKGAAQQFNSGGQKISVFSVSPDGSYLVLGTTDGVISLFDLGKGTLQLRLRWVESAGAWIAQDNAGHFDAPRTLWSQLSWSQNGKLTSIKPSQYTESLATKVLEGLPAHR